jgi:hypothetical protein
MDRLNRLLGIIIIFLVGIYVGLWISPLKHSSMSAEDYQEGYELLAQSKVELQRSILYFYMNNYCEAGTSRVIDLMYHGTKFQGVFCDKDTILLLQDQFPPLPFFILDLTIEENDDNT